FRRLKPACVGRLLPLQRALFPQINVADHQDSNVQQHLDKTEHIQLLENDGPGIKENGFDIEQYENHCHHVEMHRIRLACVARGTSAALVGLLLRADLQVASNSRRSNNKNGRDSRGEQDNQQQSSVTVDVASVHFQC